MLSTYTRMCHYYDLDGLFVGWEDPHDSDFGLFDFITPWTIFFRRYRGQMNIMCYTADGMKFMDAGASTPLDCWRRMWRAQYEFKDDLWCEYRHRRFRRCMREIRLRWAMDVVREFAYRPGHNVPTRKTTIRRCAKGAYQFSTQRIIFEYHTRVVYAYFSLLRRAMDLTHY